jgi:hypothetical protein
MDVGITIGGKTAPGTLRLNLSEPSVAKALLLLILKQRLSAVLLAKTHGAALILMT